MPTPTYDRLRKNRQVLFEYVPNETLKEYPYPDRYTMTPVTQGSIQIELNGENFSPDAPVILCTNYADKFKLLPESPYLQAQSVCFHPKFVNRSLDYASLEMDYFEELNEQPDRDMMSFFNHIHDCNGVFPLPASTYLKASQWIKLIQTKLNEDFKNRTGASCFLLFKHEQFADHIVSDHDQHGYEYF